MSHYVDTIGCDFHIKSENLGEAYRLLCELSRRDDLKRGGSGSDTYRRPADSRSVAQDPNVWFSWMPWNYDELYGSAAEILQAVGFDVWVYESGLDIEHYGNKSGCEKEFVEALAPVVEDGCYIEWEGEDRTYWRWDFEGGRMIEREGELVWH